MKHNKWFSGIVRKPLLIEMEALPLSSFTQPRPSFKPQPQGKSQVPKDYIKLFFSDRPATVVLFVDDQLNARLTGFQLLQGLGFSKVLLACDVEEALRLYEEYGPETIKLVVSDHRMPLLTGEDLFWQLKKKNDKVRMILRSGSHPPGLDAMLKGGLKDFVLKSCETEELERAIANALS